MERHKKDKLTQLVFCDFSTPGGKDKGFNVYDDIKSKLVANGVPENKIAFIHDADTEKRKMNYLPKSETVKFVYLWGQLKKWGLERMFKTG